MPALRMVILQAAAIGASELRPECPTSFGSVSARSGVRPAWQNLVIAPIVRAVIRLRRSLARRRALRQRGYE